MVWQKIQWTGHRQERLIAQKGRSIAAAAVVIGMLLNLSSACFGRGQHRVFLPALAGAYVFGDFISGRVWSLTKSGAAWSRAELTTASGADLAAIGEDQGGELYLARYSSGVVARIHQVGQP
jgi:hypothetical protein